MNNLFFALFFLFSAQAFSQDLFENNQQGQKPTSKYNYTQFDLAVPLRGNPNAGRRDQYTQTNESWFLADGLSPKVGFGLHNNNWIALGIHTGINWEWSNKIVAIPVFVNFRLSPKIAHNKKIVLQLGRGKGFAIGKRGLSGDYGKVSLGHQSDEVLIFVEVAQYDFRIGNQDKIGSFSLGISIIHF
jgi:hypothetical protein